MHIMVIGAHPDDCEIYAGCTAVRFVEHGHRVRFVSVANGDAGHHEIAPPDLARIRRAEVEEADRILGVEFVILDNHDGEIVPSLEIRRQLIRLIREFQADMVFSHRPHDYHPDHRNTGILVQDTAYLVIVPSICPEAPALRRNPIYLYLQDEFTSPEPFRPDIMYRLTTSFTRRSMHCTACPRSFTSGFPGPWKCSTRCPPVKRNAGNGSKYSFVGG